MLFFHFYVCITCNLLFYFCILIFRFESPVVIALRDKDGRISYNNQKQCLFVAAHVLDKTEFNSEEKDFPVHCNDVDIGKRILFIFTNKYTAHAMDGFNAEGAKFLGFLPR